MKNHLRNITFR